MLSPPTETPNHHATTANCETSSGIPKHVVFSSSSLNCRLRWNKPSRGKSLWLSLTIDLIGFHVLALTMRICFTHTHTLTHTHTRKRWGQRKMGGPGERDGIMMG
jgi:hypothetical protein